MQNKTLKDEVRLTQLNLKTVLRMKNGEIQYLHKTIFDISRLLDKEQEKKAFKMSQQLREKLKWLKKKYLG